MSQEIISDKIEAERKIIKSERMTMVKDAIIVIIASAILVTFLLVWKAQITGLSIADEDAFCEDHSGFAFLSPENITVSGQEGYTYQLKLSCPEGNITFHDDSDYVDVPPTGRVKLMPKQGMTEISHVMIAARPESGRRISKEFNFIIT